MKTQTILGIVLLSVSLACAQNPAPGAPVGAGLYRDLAYVEGGHERQKLDLFLPEKTTGPVPLIIWVHGGGWQNGSKDGCPPLRAGYTDRGYAVASLGYRLSQHAVFPAQIEDCKAAIRWLRAHATQYGLDPARFGIWGSSAGGHLVALVGTSGDVKTLDVGANLDQSSRVQAVCDYYGPTDFSVFVTTPGYERHATADSPEAKLIGGAIQENREKAAQANSITYVSKDDPAFLIVHGDKDPTVPINQSQLLFDALKKAELAPHLHIIHGAGHGGPGFNSPEVTQIVADFFDAQFKTKTKEKPATVPEAKITESTADASSSAAGPQRGATAANNRPRPTFDELLTRSDADKDGKLSREEFRGPPAVFQRLDRNGDGFLTRDENEAAKPPGQ